MPTIFHHEECFAVYDSIHCDNMSLLFVSDTQGIQYFLIVGRDHPDINEVIRLRKGDVVCIALCTEQCSQVVASTYGEISLRISKIGLAT